MYREAETKRTIRPIKQSQKDRIDYSALKRSASI